jgi:hypothetical protein
MPRGRTAANEIVRKVSNDTARKLAIIRATYLGVQNHADASVRDLAPEFYRVVGEVLEGRSFDEIEWRLIDPARVAPLIKST